MGGAFLRSYRHAVPCVVVTFWKVWQKLELIMHMVNCINNVCVRVHTYVYWSQSPNFNALDVISDGVTAPPAELSPTGVLEPQPSNCAVYPAKKNTVHM